MKSEKRLAELKGMNILENVTNVNTLATVMQNT
jgi:hypothetical protein